MTDETPRRRKSETRQRSQSIATRFTAEEATRLTAAAHQAGFTTGAYLRAVALGSPGPRAMRRLPVDRLEVGRLVGQLAHIGSNLNQLARVANSTGEIEISGALAETLSGVLAATDAAMRALGRGD